MGRWEGVIVAVVAEVAIVAFVGRKHGDELSVALTRIIGIRAG